MTLSFLLIVKLLMIVKDVRPAYLNSVNIKMSLIYPHEFYALLTSIGECSMPIMCNSCIIYDIASIIIVYIC